MPLINTTHGPMDSAVLARTVVFRDQPGEFTIEVEWRLGDELVRRDAHVILKEATVTADSIVGGF